MAMVLVQVFNTPDIILMVEFNPLSTSFAWQEKAHNDEAYSAAECTKSQRLTIEDVRVGSPCTDTAC